MQIASRIHRVGADSIVNSLPASRRAARSRSSTPACRACGAGSRAELAAMGRSVADVRAIVLTHGHSDHIGYAERARAERRLARPGPRARRGARAGRGAQPGQGGRPDSARDSLVGSCGGRCATAACGSRHLGEVSTFGDGATLDVPGSPRVIARAGAHARQRRAPRRRPRRALRRRRAVHPRRHDRRDRAADRAVLAPTRSRRGHRSARLEGVAARLVLPGHGDAFDGRRRTRRSGWPARRRCPSEPGEPPGRLPGATVGSCPPRAATSPMPSSCPGSTWARRTAS